MLHSHRTGIDEVTKSTKSTRRRATLQLEFLIVGGGVGGLACACALTWAGHRVQVLEKCNGLEQRSGGIRLPPNLTKIFGEWGLADQLARTAQTCHNSNFYDLEAGNLLGWLEWKEAVIKETGGDFLLIHYDDIYRMLYDLAISNGATVTFGSPVTSVTVDQVTNTPRVYLASGEVLDADVVIGADGYQSIVRNSILQKDDDRVDSEMSAITITIPSELMKSDPELALLPDISELPVWMGTSRCAFSYPIRNGREYNVNLFWPDSLIDGGKDSDIREGWGVHCSTESLDVSGCIPLVQRLIKLAPSATRTRFVKRGPLEEWFDQSRKVVLIGEAAHPILPCTWSGISLAVEDATVLGTLFSRFRDWDQLPILLQAFQDLRQPRCAKVAQLEVTNAATAMLPPGPRRDERNMRMKKVFQSKVFWDDVKLRQQWEELEESFGYNAKEDAEAWWVNWGVLEESSKDLPAFEPLDLTFEMTEVLTPDSAVMV